MNCRLHTPKIVDDGRVVCVKCGIERDPKNPSDWKHFRNKPTEQERKHMQAVAVYGEGNA